MIRWLVCLLTLTLSSATAAAQTPVGVRPLDEAQAILGPPAPIAPEVVRRDAQGRVTIRAVRIEEGLHIDGRLDEEIYQLVPPIGGFEQIEPKPGEPATEKTELWIFFDRDFLYVSARAWDPHPETQWVVNGIVRDSTSIPRSENIAFFLDTFYSRRNASVFEINADGGIWDGEITNEKFGGSSWNPVWS